MTVDELKCEAKKMGYNLILAKPMEKLITCTCGCNRREHGYKYEDGHSWVQLKCKRCGKKAPWGTSEAEARHNWNEMERR